MKRSTLSCPRDRDRCWHPCTAGCASTTCPEDEQPATTHSNTEFTLKRSSENTLKDLEIYNARASMTDSEEGGHPLESRIDNALKALEMATTRILKADHERRNALLRRTGIER